MFRQGRVIGVLEVANRHGGGDYDDDDRARLEGLAAEVGEECDPERLCLDSDAMRALLARAVRTAPSEAAALLLLDPAGRELVFRASRTIQSGLIDGMRLPVNRGIAGWVARHRQAVRLDDVASDPRHFAGVGAQTGLAPRTMICVPMISKDTLRGVIQILNKVDGSTFTEAELSLAQTLADHAAIAIENASLYRQAYVASITDDLTGLGNTRHFHRSLADVLTRGVPVSLIVLDLDNFKAVVDRYGHLAGSRTIAQIGRTIGRAGAARRRGGALRRRRVRDRAPGHGHGGGGAARRVDPQGDRGVRAPGRRGGRPVAGDGERRRRNVSGCTRPMRRACSGRRTPQCTWPSGSGKNRVAVAPTGPRVPGTSASPRPPGASAGRREQRQPVAEAVKMARARHESVRCSCRIDPESADPSGVSRTSVGDTLQADRRLRPWHRSCAHSSRGARRPKVTARARGGKQ